MRRDCDSSANSHEREIGSFSILSKNRKSSDEHFQEVSNDKSSDAGLSRVESESVAETLKAVKSGKYLNRNLTFEKIM